MFILLPPSEGKHSGGGGMPLSARSRSGALARRLAPTRLRVLQALQATLAAGAAEATSRLMLPESGAATLLSDNERVLDAPTMPALRRYSGVLFDGLAAPSLSAHAQRNASRWLLIFSGLFGVLRADEPVPPYRVPAQSRLVGLGTPGALWRRELPDVLPSVLGQHPSLDLRSTDYAAMWRPSAELRDQLITVRIESRTKTGYGVVSYTSKLAKGRLARALLELPEPAQDPEQVAQLWRRISGGTAAVLSDPRATLLLRTD